MPESMKEELLKAYEILKQGGIILYPTDTIWGIGCDATNAKAIERIYKIKKRSVNKNMIILLDFPEKLYQYVSKIPETAFDFINNIKTPLTIVYPGAKNLPKILIAKDGSIAIRIVREEFCQKLIGLLNKPLISTSANISGEANPLIFSKVNPDIIKKVDYVVTLNKNSIKQLKSSTIIQFNTNGEYEIIRA
ncbi:MAG: L-threonylcarbamoyladenylate synthase [Bacteroidales bacterium]|jgi:L-threonylcarbamoyladenylate synthase|nr:L-threonylcarbamoyladenylate synthase [Bacteroidales bacterium]MDD4214949.1 L-threonylcarbamoyladenylate synthase [Bacteroidales bacterium]